MRYVWIISLFLPFLAAADTRFLPLPQDFPIMDGLKIQKSKEAIFSNLEGRVMVYVANTQNPIEKVQQFYAHTLQNLGWKLDRKNPNIFIRHLEQVELSFEPVGSTTQVTFTFKPCS